MGDLQAQLTTLQVNLPRRSLASQPYAHARRDVNVKNGVRPSSLHHEKGEIFEPLFGQGCAKRPMRDGGVLICTLQYHIRGRSFVEIQSYFHTYLCVELNVYLGAECWHCLCLFTEKCCPDAREDRWAAFFCHAG